MDVSIVIPTKNAGPLFEKVLDMIFSQKTIYEYEVICVDSGSKDQTLEVIKKYPCKLYQIPAFSSNTYFQELAAVGDKRFKFNPYYDMVVPQTDYEKIWSDPTNRCALSKRDKGIFLKEGRFS